MESLSNYRLFTFETAPTEYKSQQWQKVRWEKSEAVNIPEDIKKALPEGWAIGVYNECREMKGETADYKFQVEDHPDIIVTTNDGFHMRLWIDSRGKKHSFGMPYPVQRRLMPAKISYNDMPNDIGFGNATQKKIVNWANALKRVYKQAAEQQDTITAKKAESQNKINDIISRVLQNGGQTRPYGGADGSVYVELFGVWMVLSIDSNSGDFIIPQHRLSPFTFLESLK